MSGDPDHPVRFDAVRGAHRNEIRRIFDHLRIFETEHAQIQYSERVLAKNRSPLFLNALWPERFRQ